MASRRIILLLASAVAVFVVSSSAAPATLLPGPITRLRVVSRTTLRPGVIFTHYRANVRGYPRAQEIYRISWAIGDTHVTLGSALLGTYHPDQETVDVHPISSLGAPAALLAAINGDYSAYTTRTAYRNSGMLVKHRKIYNFGWGGPGVGYLPAGDFEIGRPRAKPVKLKLPNRLTATIGAFGALPAASDQVGAYDTAGTVVTVPEGVCGVHGRLDGVSHHAERQPHLAQPERATTDPSRWRRSPSLIPARQAPRRRSRSSAASRRARR